MEEVFGEFVSGGVRVFALTPNPVVKHRVVRASRQCVSPYCYDLSALDEKQVNIYYAQLRI